ncbi:MAG TPA: polysaccharide deacetylase family protein [Candidatus Binataceae bacterium]|nr:polysaccharide deacetylase family protein [Candidatus Binataceae bacterium]
MGATKLRVLMYHDVGPSIPGAFPGGTIPSAEFGRQIAWLADSGYVGIRPSDWISWHRKGKPLPRKPVLITFDDGYAGVASYGLPVLERYGFGAAVFVVTGRIGFTNTWDQALGYSAVPLMSADEIVRWTSRGIEFGCHTRTHPNLAMLSEAQIHNEVVGSRDDLAAIVGRVPCSFAYPWGSFNRAVHDCVRSAFDLAFSTRRGVNSPGTDPHLLRRGAIHANRSMLDFACRVMFGLNPLGRLEWMLRGSGRKPLRYQT